MEDTTGYGIESIMECCVTESIVSDEVSFNMWVDGRTPQEAEQAKRRALFQFLFGDTPPAQLRDAQKRTWATAQKLSIQECIDQFQIYEWMLPYFYEPKSFEKQMTFVLDEKVLEGMIERFYSFDEIVMRELLGKVTSKAVRRDLEDMTEGSSVAVKSARRQFDNMKRVMTHVQQVRAVRINCLGTAITVQFVPEGPFLVFDFAARGWVLRGRYALSGTDSQLQRPMMLRIRSAMSARMLRMCYTMSATDTAHTFICCAAKSNAITRLEYQECGCLYLIAACEYCPTG
eukprot:1791034-Rhodomonas_salina.1